MSKLAEDKKAADEKPFQLKKLGQVAEAVADFWLGMATAGAKGLGQAGESMKDRDKDAPIYKTVAQVIADAAKTTFEQASETAKQTVEDLRKV